MTMLRGCIFWALLAATLILAAFGIPNSARAQERQLVCYPLADLLAVLRDKQQEFAEMTADAGLYKIYLTVSPTGAWTLLRVDRGVACIVGAGKHLEWLKGV